MSPDSHTHPAPDQEIAALRQRIAELEAQLTTAQQHAAFTRQTKQQHMMQLIIDSLPGAVFWKDADLVYQGCNQLFASFAGVGTPANIVGKTDYDLAWKREEADFFRDTDRRVMDANVAEYHIIEPQQQADGKQAWLDTNKIPLHDGAGNVIGILGTYEDITERKQTEEALRASEQRFRTLTEALTVAMWIHHNGQFVYANPATASMLDYSLEELLNERQVWDIIHPDFVDTVRQRAEARQRGEQVPPRYEVQVVTKHGEARWVELHANPIVFEGAPSILVTFIDITARKQLEVDIRASEQRFRTLTENITAGVFIHHSGQFVYTNPAGEALTGYTAEELRTITFADLVHPDYLHIIMQRASARQAGEQEIPRYEIKIITRGGDERWVDINNSLIEYDGHASIIITAIDITPLKRSEEATRASEQRFRTLTETTPVATWIHKDGAFLYVNPATEQVLGYTAQQLLTMHVWDIVHPDLRDLMRKTVQARQQGAEAASRYELRILTSSGDERWVDVNASPIEFEGQMAVLGNGLDITERKRSEKERTRLHESIIQEQAASLRELSTPLIPLSRRIVAMPLIGRIDSGRAQQIMDVLLQGIADHQATTAILDITGVPIVDNRVATVLLEAAQAVRLLGAQVILTGIRPDVAQSLVSLDMQLTDIVTRGSLQAGIAYALGRHLD